MKNKYIIMLSLCLMLVIVTMGVTIAIFRFSREGEVENVLETSTVVLTYTEGKTGITLYESYPISDEKGKVLTGENNVFDFTVQANSAETFAYNQFTKIDIGENVTTIGYQAFLKVKSGNSNPNLATIINRTGRWFEWKAITYGRTTANFVTGTILHSDGDIKVVASE